MLFIREYNAKSLDRSSVSMIDKYNVRLDIVGQLLANLSSLIENLLALIIDIRNTLGQSKQRIYNNLDQVKEVIDGNGITGTESTIAAIESALEAGDKAIDEAEATLEGVQAAVECDQEYCDDAVVDVECGETCNEIPDDDWMEGCEFCAYTEDIDWPEDHPCGLPSVTNVCAVCAHEGCDVSVGCNEECSMIVKGGNCTFSWTRDSTCDQNSTVRGSCNEISCSQNCSEVPEGCSFTCTHSSPCLELPIPEDCTYSCKDGGNCNYDNTCNECSYATICDFGSFEDMFDCVDWCLESMPCGETCHMTNDSGGSEGDCSEESCGEDGPCNQFDCSEYDCGEPCGETCGLF